MIYSIKNIYNFVTFLNMPVLLLEEDLFERDDIFGSGIVDVFKGLVGSIRKFAPTKEGIRFLTGSTSLGAIADRVLPLIQPLLNQAIEKGIPLLTESALQALGGFGSQSAQAALRAIAIPASKKLGKALIKTLDNRVKAGTKRRKALKKKTAVRRAKGGRAVVPFNRRRTKAFPSNLNPRNQQFLQQLLQMNRLQGRTITGSGLIEL